MNETMRAGMREATRLTQAGRLSEATDLIQRTLRGMNSSAAADKSRGEAGDAPIEGSFRVLETARLGPAVNADVSGERRSETRSRFQTPQHPQWRGFNRPASRFKPVAPGPTPDVVPDGGRFLPGSYTNSAGTRDYKLYIPSGYHGQALPLIVMLHGCTQGIDDFAAGTRMNAFAEEQRWLVAYPAQALAANVSRCWNWFKETDQQRDRGEPSLIAGITRQIVDSYCVDARRIHVAGLSAGGAMAAIMGKTYPDLYAAVGIHSGPDHSAAHDMLSAFSAMRGAAAPGGARNRGAARPTVVPTIVFHGDRDTTVHPSNGKQVGTDCNNRVAEESLEAQYGADPRVTLERGQVPQGHAYSRTIYRDARDHVVVELWLVHGAGHAWSGGSARGSYTDPGGPDATREMLRFFSEHPASS
ncbi:MAG: PHB depolymerase family esterase [Aquisalimonadaceae bacterium]